MTLVLICTLPYNKFISSMIKSSVSVCQIARARQPTPPFGSAENNLAFSSSYDHVSVSWHGSAIHSEPSLTTRRSRSRQRQEQRFRSRRAFSGCIKPSTARCDHPGYRHRCCCVTSECRPVGILGRPLRIFLCSRASTESQIATH